MPWERQNSHYSTAKSDQRLVSTHVPCMNNDRQLNFVVQKGGTKQMDYVLLQFSIGKQSRIHPTTFSYVQTKIG